MQILKTRSFTWWEMGLLKVCLISLGILIGTYFAVYAINLTIFWCVLFVTTAIYFLVKFFREG
jgi:hypothetical protein